MNPSGSGPFLSLQFYLNLLKNGLGEISSTPLFPSQWVVTRDLHGIMVKSAVMGNGFSLLPAVMRTKHCVRAGGNGDDFSSTRSSLVVTRRFGGTF